MEETGQRDGGTPERSLAQRMEALQRANDIRTKRARLKKRIKAGKVSVAQVVAEPAPELHTMKLFDVLLATPKVGKVKANRIVQQARVSPSKTLGGLTERQRGEVVPLLPGVR